MCLKTYLMHEKLFPSKKNTVLNVLMVTGIYHPEVSGAANQCRQLINTLKGKASFLVLTTTRDPNLPQRGQVDGIDVTRLLWGKVIFNYFKTIFKFATFLFNRRKDFQIIHLHGFSLKSVFLTLISKILGKKVIIKMTSIGHDDPISMRQRSFPLNYCFSKADAYVGVTSHFNKLYAKSQLPLNRYIEIPNGVDIDRFRPAVAGEREILRDQLGLPTKIKLILFVGHFSREKCPDILLEAWKYFVAELFLDTGVIFVGATKTDHYEVDARLVEDIQELAAPYINERIFFIERAHEIEKYYQTADIFVLPSLREGLPNALLEAMACCLPVIVSRLEGVMDWVVTGGMNGLIVESEKLDDLGKAISQILKDDNLAESLGLEARKTIVERFSINKVAEDYLQLYGKLVT